MGVPLLGRSAARCPGQGVPRPVAATGSDRSSGRRRCRPTGICV